MTASGAPVALTVALVIYLLAMLGLSLRARGEVRDLEDFLVAGRRLGFWLATGTLMATWLGAGAVLASSDEVRDSGLAATALEPIGAGLCLVVAGLWFARPLWEARLLTLADFYKQRFGRTAEILFGLSAFTFFAWIAAQLVGMAGILEVFWGVPLGWGVAGAAAVACGYTLIGGMWSVTLTDAAQVALLVIGVALLGWEVLGALGGAGAGDTLAAATTSAQRAWIPTESAAALLGWLDLLLIGTLGNLAGTDLMQRVFAARSAAIARRACLASGVAYVAIGLVPAFLGLAAHALLPAGDGRSVIPALAQAVMGPVGVVVLVLALVSAILSTLDSALLAAASVLAHNVVRPWVPARVSTIALTRAWVILGAGLSVALALAGESAYSLLESSYAMTLAGPFVPLALGLRWSRGGERAAVASLTIGYGVWLLEAVWSAVDPGGGYDGVVPITMIATVASLVAYVTVAMRERSPT